MAAEFLLDLDFGPRTAVAKYLGRSQSKGDLIWALKFKTIKIRIHGIKDVTVSLSIS